MEEDHSRPTRKELIGIRRKLYNLPAPKRRRRHSEEVHQRKKPGRKPETLLARGLKKNDFGCAQLPSDVESDYEGYLSESEDITGQVPKLTRSQSSDSIFLDMTYKDYRFNRVSFLHQCSIHRPKHPIAKLKRRKMNRISQKHALRYATLQLEYLAFKEMLECYHGNLPCLADEIARTKNCIRNPHKHKKLNVPRVFVYGEADLVDVCAHVLRDTVAHVVAFEHASIDAGNTITCELQETRVKRRLLLETQPIKLNPRLPSWDYLAMEFFFLRHVKSRNDMAHCFHSLKKFTQRCKYFAVDQPKYLLMHNMRMKFVEREEYEFEEFLKTQHKLKRHLDRTLKEVLIENRSYQAEAHKDHERRLARREHAEKVAARAKLPPEERARLAEEDKKNKEERDKEKARLKEIQKKTKELKARIITSRLRQEARDKKKNDAKEAKLRYLHRKRIRRMQDEAIDEKCQLRTKYQKIEAIRENRLKKQEKERREAARKKHEMRAKQAEERRKVREAEERKLQKEQEKKEREAEKRRRIEEEELKKIDAEKKRAREARKRMADLEERRRLAAEIRQAEEMRRRKIEREISRFRAKTFVAEFAKEVYRHIERNREITLLMCFEDKRNKYKSAKEAFKTAKCDKLMEKVVPQFVAAYKAISDWNKIREYLNNFSDPAIAAMCDIPQCYQQIAKNIASGYIYKKGDNLERKWFFLGNMESLFHNVDPDMKTRLMEKMRVPVHPSISPSLLHSYLVHTVFRRGQPTGKIRELSDDDDLDSIVFSKSLLFPNSSSPFWKLISRWMHRKKNNCNEENEMSAYLARRDSAAPNGSVQWIFPVLGVCYTFVVVRNHKTAKRVLLERKIEHSSDSNECLEKLSDQLTAIGSYFEEAMCCPENLIAMFEHNGFYPVVRMLSKLIRQIFQLLTCLDLPKLMKPESTIDDALSVLFKEIEKHFKKVMIGNWRIAADNVSKMRSFVDDTIFYIQASTDRSQEPDIKVKVMGAWVHWIKKHFEPRIQEITQKALMETIHEYNNPYVEPLSPLREDDYDYVPFNESMSRDSSVDDNSDLESIQEDRENIEEPIDDCSISGVGRKRSKHAPRYSMKRPRTDSSDDTDFTPTRPPSYADQFIQQVFRTIEESFQNLSLHEKRILKSHLHEKFDQNHLEESLYRFHMMERISDDGTQKHDRHNWSHYRRRSIQFNEEEARSAEDTFLCLFEHVAVTEEEFRRLKWEVPRKNGLPIQPIEFFTNLNSYRSQECYNNNVANNSLPFFFHVYHHIWFMGALAPPCYSANSHETVPNGWCGGCTNGDVIIIPDCTCENHRDAEKGNFCYTRTKVPLEDAQLNVDRLLGRFVCEHGPSSCLVLDYKGSRRNEKVRDDREWEPFASRYTSFESSLTVENIDSTYKNLVDTVPQHPDDLETTGSFWPKYAPHLLKLRKSRSHAKPQRRRTKSEEAPIRQKNGDNRYFNRVASCMDLTEINKYVAKKWNFARRAISPVRKIVRSASDIPPSFDEEDVSSLENLFSRTNSSNDARRFDMLVAMIECGCHVQSEEDDGEKQFTMISSFYKNYGLLRVAGEPINKRKNEASLRNPMARIPMVAKLHKEFVTFKEIWMEEARKSLFTIKEIGDEQKYEAYKKLTNCYIEIFRFYLYLFRLYLDTVEFHIFNCYAVYEAEKKQDDTFIREGMRKVKNTVGSVSNAFFNEQPLIRQLEELCQIKDKHTKEEMNSYVAALCRYAINRVRAPAIADSTLNASCWVNFTRNHEITLTVARLGIESTIPSEFNEDKYLEKLHRRGFRKDVFKRITNTFYGANIGVAHSVLLAVNYQFDDLFENIRTLIPTGSIDPVMRVYYGQQAFRNVINVLYRKTHYLTERNCRQIGNVHTSVLLTGIIERGRHRQNFAMKSGLDELFVEMSEQKSVSSPIYPSTIGVAFACFERILFISVVQESNILLDQSQCVTKKHIPEHEEIATVVDVDKREFHMIVDKRNGELSISFSLNNGPNKVDRFVVNKKLHKKYFSPEINWEGIWKYFNGKLNNSARLLNTLSLTRESDSLKIGRLERRRE